MTSNTVITLTSNETAPVGGWSLTQTGTASFSLTLDGGGFTVTAPTPQASGVLHDALIEILGGDYITIQNFVMRENNSNTTIAAGTNNMTEWGVAVFYATATNGSQNISILNNNIDLDRTYQNTSAIYVNATHTSTVVTTSATATGANGGNHNLVIRGNTITEVNMGIIVIGPTAAADQNTTVDIGGATAPEGNTITNFGTTGTFSGYANVSGTVNGILLRNTRNYTISRNTVTSSNGGVTVGTLNGIQVAASSNAPTGTLTQAINNNTLSLRPGASVAINGINLPSSSVNATTTCNINSNDFNTFGHTVAATSAITFITQGGNPLTQTFNSNTFTNMSVNTTGTITFFSFAPTMISGASLSLSSNSIVTGFTRTGVGSTTVWSSNASSVNGSSHTMNSNNFSNITLTGASAFTGLSNTDGASASSGPVKSVNGNTFNNITTGAGTVTPMSVNFSGPASNVNTNTITNITSGSSITCLSVGNSNQATITVAGNTISGINSAGTTVTGLAMGAFTASVSKNKICDLNGSVAGSVVTGMSLTSGTTNTAVTASNNIIGNLTAPIATGSNAIRGIDLNGSATTGTFNLFYNTVYLNNTTSGVGFGSSALFALGNATATTSALNLRNNILVNTSVQNGAGLTVAYRRTTGAASTLANYASTSNNNLFYAGAPGANNLIYADGTSTAQTLALYKAGVFTAGTVAPRDAASVTENPPFLSTLCGNANFLHMSTVIATGAESGGATVAVTDDFDGDVRGGTPDIGADEFAGTPLALCSGTPATSTITGAASVCINSGTTLALSTVYTDLLITYQWRSGTTSGVYPNTLGTSSTQATGPLTVPTYFICEVTCNNGGTFTMTTVEKLVGVNALPTVTVNGVGAATGTYCTPGGSSVTLTAGGAVTYSWSPTSGLTPTSGSPVAAAPTSTTNYTVTGTDANGCVNTATAAVSVLANPTGVTATATPASICTGSTSNLTSTGVLPAAPSNYTFSGAAGTYSAISGTTVANASTDDGGQGNLPIGFNFAYNGGVQTIFSAGANGLMILGDATANYISGTNNYPFTNALASNANRIAPLWDDNNCTGGNIQYLTIGSPGSRILTVQWTGMHTGGTGSATNPTIDVQVKLYEVDGAVEFIYGATSAALAGTTASIGISGNVGNFLSVTPLSPANTSTASSGTENTSISSATNFPSGTTYRFAPVLPTFSWASPTNLVSPSSQNTATNALSVTETFTVTVSNGACSATATATVSIDPLSCSAATATGPFCAGSNFTVAANRTGGGAPFTYAWSDGVGGVYPNAASITANLPAGTYNFTCAISDACGGSCNSNVSVTVNGLPTPTISPAGAVNFCVSGTLTSSSASGNVWSPGGATTQSITATADGSYTVSVTDGNSCVGTSPATVVTISAQPSALSVNPPTPAAICAGGSVVLNTVGGTVSGTVTQTSGTISLTIPDVNATGINNAFTLSGVPGGATIDSVIVTMSITHSFVQDLIVNLEAPNGQIVNLAGGVAGATGSAYTGTRISSNDAFPALLGATAGHAGTYRADKRTTAFQLTPATPPTTALWSALYSVPNGTWRLRVIDDESIGTGTLTNWQIKVVYSAPTVYTWTPPASGLDTYTGTTVTASPTATQAYTVTSTNGACSSTANVTVNINTTDTDGDGIIDCIDNCPSYPGQIGDYCNVNYPGSPFLFGQINGSCQCVAVPCTETVTMELRTDALSSQASWQILLQGTNQVVCQFSVPIDGITSPITDNCCLPVGCYRLRVSDSGGDGFVSGGITGGYQLRESGPNGRRIIDNLGNFTNLAGGPPDVSAIASTYDNGAFCVPVGSDRPIYSSCDKLDWVANKYIVATENAAVTGQFNVTNTTSGYVFWFFDPNGSYSYRRFRNHATSDGFGTGATRACHFRVNGWTNTPTTPHLPSNVLLNVRIRGRVADVNLPFGPACLFKIDAARAACPLVKLQDNPLDNDYSCGVSRYFGGANTSGNRIIANPPQPVPTVSSANVRYQFRFRNGEYPNPDGCIVRPPQTSAQLNLNWSAATGTQLKCNTQYDVDVRVSLDGGVTWCVGNPSSAPALNCADPGDPSTAWGKVCSVNITTSTNCPGPLQGSSSSIGAQQGGNLTMYPNPNRGEQLFISLTEVGADVNTVTVDIYDMTGKRVTARTIAVQDGFVKTNIDLNGDLAGGLYMVNITAGDKTYTERLVIQP